METFHRCQVLVVAVSLALAVLVSAPGARADIPMCNAVYADPTIPTCTCICEGPSGGKSNSSFPGCSGLDTGAAAPTPDQCPDMLQGRRVLSAGDALLASDPTPQSTDTRLAALLFAAENDATTPGLGTIDGDPSVSAYYAACQVNADPFPMQTRFARLFNKPYDMMVTLRPHNGEITADCHATSGSANNLLMEIRSEVADAPSVQFPMLNSDPFWVQLAIGDFDYDGFDDILYMNAYSMQVWSASDPADPTKPVVLRSGTGTKDPSGALRAPINEPVIGDFNGDGIKDVAWIGGDFPNGQGTLSVFFASICPGSVPNTICAGAQPFQIIMDPAAKLFPGVTSTIVLDNAPTTPTACGAINLAGTDAQVTGSLRAGAVALGNFDNNGLNPRGEPVDELVVTYVSGSAGTSSDPCSTDVQYYAYSPPTSDGSTTKTWADEQASASNILNAYWFLSQVSNGIPPTINLYAQAAHLDWYGTLEQAVIAVNGMNIGLNTDAGSFYFPVTVAVTGSGAAAKMAVCSGALGSGDKNYLALWGLAVGRFSTSTTVNPNNPGACGDFADANPGDCPYNPQIALLPALNNGSSFRHFPSIFLWNVRQSQPDGTDDSLKCANDPTVNGFLPVAFNNIAIENNTWQSVDWQGLRSGSLLHAGDAFGNSVRLGTPTIARVNEHSEPQLIIQAPPSLLDYVTYVQSNGVESSTPAIVNFSRSPAEYQTQIQFGTSSTDTASTQQTTSYTASTTETLSGEVKFPVADLGSVDVKNKESWNQFHQDDQTQKLSTYSTTQLQTGGAIGADDQVWWTDTTFNVFNFPQLGVTTCPASTTCDPGDTACTGTFSNAELTCSKPASGKPGYPDCVCLSAGTSETSGCPDLSQLPSGTTRSCASQSDGSVCCSLLPQPLTVSFSGPQEVTRKSQSGSDIEWYQPRHEPGQILSYPANVALLEARVPNAASLATLTSYTLGSNDNNQSISWTCGTNSSVSSGTTTRHSFASDSSITVGTNDFAKAAGGVSASIGFDYQHSDSFSSLNSYTVGLTASSEVGLLLKGAGFLNPEQYAYDVAGVVLGADAPGSVLDNPDLTVCPVDPPDPPGYCTTANMVQADCTTTGPVTVAFAADPTEDGDGGWWNSELSPYRHNIDVALNNPTRWLGPLGPSDDGVFNQHLQCRGPSESECYAHNQPPATDSGMPSASEVWDSDFYNMKGLFVTLGGTTGPLRTTATVGDEVFLQARVYNYSLKTMATGTKVYARFYRQQLDVNNDDNDQTVAGYAVDANGNPLPAVPIGPTGLGDTDPVPVVGPDGVSNTIPGFNTTNYTDYDNIGLATTSYTAAGADACEYDNDTGVQSCDGAYYAYWVTVWAENTNNNPPTVISELPGHGLGAGFDPNTSYGFITDVPLAYSTVSSTESDSFTNNVGMFKEQFSIVPAPASGTLAATRPHPGPLSLDRMHLSRDKTVLGKPVVVSAQVVEGGESAPGATVVFSDGDPKNGGKTFDAEWLPTIRAHDRNFVRVNYNPESCGPHAIYADVTGGSNVGGPAEQFAMLDVGIDYHSAIHYLIEKVRALNLNFPGNASSAHKANLVRELNQAEQALDENRTGKAVHSLEQFTDALTRLEREGRIDKEQVDALNAQVQQIIGCV